MTLLRFAEVTKMKREDIEAKLKDFKKELIKINAQIAIGSAIENPGKVKELRRTIARLNMVLHKKPTEVKQKDG